jgi:hypothetical protein
MVQIDVTLSFATSVGVIGLSTDALGFSPQLVDLTPEGVSTIHLSCAVRRIIQLARKNGLLVL